MKKFEYQLRHIKEGLGKKLNEYGNEGWQLIQLVPHDAGGHVLYMMREKVEE